ncbi:MAG TPA: BREX system ATP-binding domain-containing protein [Spirochaetia bacterium]|nr:BREX system ATP-binding domain-containing protein [Spirochaetia bacterium]
MDNPELLAVFRKVPAAEMLNERQILEAFVDPGSMEEFLRRWYLNEFIDRGAGKVKFVRGRAGAGKTHFLRHLGLQAGTEGYLAVHIDALLMRLGAIDELYLAVAARVPWEDMIDRCALNIIRERLGYEDFQLPVPEFWGWVEKNHSHSFSRLKVYIREETDKWIAGLDLDAAWAAAVRGWVQRRLQGETEVDPVWQGWLRGEKQGAMARRSMGVTANIDRRSARAMLLSLAVLVANAGYRGLVLLIDNLDVMARTARVDGVPYYTRNWRDQGYEMFRELIDQSHQAAFLLIVVAGAPELFENQKTGFPSYPALWSRVWSEVVPEQVDRFADLIDLDRLWQLDPADRSRLAEAWRVCRRSPGVEHPPAGPSPETWGLEWSVVRRTVARVVADSEGGDPDGR